MVNDSKYGRITTSNKEIPENEPVFLLRGQDRLAWRAVLGYSRLREDAGDGEAAEEIREFAMRMKDWRPQKDPD